MHGLGVIGCCLAESAQALLWYNGVPHVTGKQCNIYGARLHLPCGIGAGRYQVNTSPILGIGYLLRPLKTGTMSTAQMEIDNMKQKSRQNTP